MWACRIIKYNPAVTRVEECTNAEIGVGAAIAMGSQGEKGKSALLVIKVMTNINPKNLELEALPQSKPSWFEE